MSALDFAKLLTGPLDGTFALTGNLVKSCLFAKTETDAGTGLQSGAALEATVAGLFVDYHSSDIDGSAVLVGDEKCIVRSRELAGVVPPAAGDTLVENLSGLRRVVVAARENVSGAFWVLQVRRSMTEDAGDLQPAASRADFGDLNAATTFDDWQA